MTGTDSPRDGLGQKAHRRTLTDAALGVPLWAVCTGTMAGYLGERAWFLDLLSHFRVQYAVVLAVCVALATWSHRWGVAAVATGCMLVNVAAVVPVWFSPGAPSVPAGTGTSLSVLVLNVELENEEHAAVAARVKALDADVVVLFEIDGRWVRSLAPVLARYPYQVAEPAPDRFGIGLYSRVPMFDSAIVQFEDALVPIVSAKLDVRGRALTFVGIHAPPPVGPIASRARNAHLEGISARRAVLGDPLLVCGDFNMSPWSPHFERFVATSGLRDTRAGFGLHATWPTHLPFLRIPIDHCLVSPQVTTVARHVGSAVGSDHFPVYLELLLP